MNCIIYRWNGLMVRTPNQSTQIKDAEAIEIVMLYANLNSKQRATLASSNQEVTIHLPATICSELTWL